MTIPHIGDVLKAIHGGAYDDQLKYIVQQAYLRRGDLTGEYLLTGEIETTNGLVVVPGATTQGSVTLDGITYREVFPGSLRHVSTVMPYRLVYPINNTGGRPYFTYNEKKYLKDQFLGEHFVMDRGDFKGCICIIDKIQKVNFHGRILSKPLTQSGYYNPRMQRLVAAAVDKRTFRFSIDLLEPLLDS